MLEELQLLHHFRAFLAYASLLLVFEPRHDIASLGPCYTSATRRWRRRRRVVRAATHCVAAHAAQQMAWQKMRSDGVF